MSNLSAVSARNADLYYHLTVLDGILTPHGVAARATAHGAMFWVSIDHDEVGGQTAVYEAATVLGVGYLSGVETSVTWAGRTLHIVSLDIDSGNTDLMQSPEHTRSSHCARAGDISVTFAKLGIESAYEGALRCTGNPDMVSHTHFTRFLVEHGHCRNTHEMLDHYLGDGKPGYVPYRWARLADTIDWIKGADDVVMTVYPRCYTLSLVKHGALFDGFGVLGGEGVEVAADGHMPDQYVLCTNIVRRYNLLASRGSGFHGPGEGRAEPDAPPSLPDNLTPVWSRWMS